MVCGLAFSWDVMKTILAVLDDSWVTLEKIFPRRLKHCNWWRREGIRLIRRSAGFDILSQTFCCSEKCLSFSPNFKVY